MLNIITVLTTSLIAIAPPPTSRAAAVPEDSANMTLVVVENDRNVPVTVYLQNEVGELKLGVVGALGDTTILIPNYVLDEGEIQFFVHPAGQLEEGTGPVDIQVGERIGLIIPPRKEN